MDRIYETRSISEKKKCACTVDWPDGTQIDNRLRSVDVDDVPKMDTSA